MFVALEEIDIKIAYPKVPDVTDLCKYYNRKQRFAICVQLAAMAD